MLKISALLVLLLGTAMVGRGLNLSGFNFSIPGTGPARNVARIQDGKQYVTSTLTNGSYEPIFVQAGIPVAWTITASADNLNGCNNPLIVPRYHIKKQLAAGKNLIEFTPEQSGTIGFSCWMGMINSSIRVVDDLTKIDPEEVKAASP
jgi:plastocyanin domain-containing protein